MNKQHKEKISQASKAVGTITVHAHKSCECFMNKTKGYCRHKLGGKFRPHLQTIVQKNIIMKTSGRGLDALVQWLLSAYNASNVGLGINYGAIGTGSTTPANTDTQLATESARTTVAFAQDVGFNQANLQFFFTNTALANTTYREFGTFVGGTASANSGNLFNRALFTTPYVKATGTDTTVEVDIAFS